MQVLKCLSGQVGCISVDHGSNTTKGGIHLMTISHFMAEPFIITLPLSGYDLNNVERDIKYTIIIITVFMSLMYVFS